MTGIKVSWVSVENGKPRNHCSYFGINETEDVKEFMSDMMDSENIVTILMERE